MTTFRDHMEEIQAAMDARAAEIPTPLSLMQDCDDAVEEGAARCICNDGFGMNLSCRLHGMDVRPAVEPEPSHAELHARLKLSIELVKQARRITDLEAKVSRLLSALIVAGIWPRDKDPKDLEIP